MMKTIFNNKKYFIALLALFVLASCKVEKIRPVAESTKTIEGSWKVTKAIRNGTDITNHQGVDFSNFRVNFEGGNYTLDNRMPFIVKDNGTFSFDDPQYPFKITFTPTGTSAISTSFSFPIVNGARTITFKFSPNGECTTNAYTYTLEKVN